MSVRNKAIALALGVAVAVFTPVVASTTASAENSCHGEAMVSFNADYAAVRSPGTCYSLSVKHRYFAGGQWFWTPVANYYEPAKNAAKYSAVKKEIDYGMVCAARIYVSGWTCAYGSWEGPITNTWYAEF